MRQILPLVAALLIAGCAKTSTVMVASNEVLVTTSASQACGPTGVVQVAQKASAIATIKAGYDKYIVLGSQSGSSYSNGWSNQSFHIRMFKNGERGSANAISARHVLGPNWAEAVKSPPMTCTD